MLINYLRVAFRNIRRNKLYSVVNIGGLALGLAVCMTILLYVVHEHSYDQFHKDARRIFLMSGTMKMGDQTVNMTGMNHVDGPMISQADPNVEAYIRLFGWGKNVDLSSPSDPAIRYTEKKGFLFADSNFFSFFSFRLKRGNAATVLSDPGSVVLTESAAKKYFGSQDPVGQTLLYNGRIPLKVQGICADVPSNSSLSFSFIAPFSLIRHTEDSSMLLQNWFGNGNFFTFFKLKDTAAARKVEATAKGMAALDKSGMSANMSFILHRLVDMHLGYNVLGGSSPRYLNIFSIVAGLVLLLALINYMSLSTARAVTRAKEVGVRKAIGADRKSIAAQFYTESALYAVLAFAAGTLLFILLREPFLQLLGKSIDASFLVQPMVIGSFAILLVLTIVIAGSYPSLVLSAYNPVVVLYGRLSRRRGGAWVRKSFTVLQFSISIALIICSLFIAKQLNYLRHADMGLEKNNVVMISCGKTFSGYPAFKSQVTALSSVAKTATADFQLFNGYNMTFIKPKGTTAMMMMNMMNVDTGFMSLLGLSWKEKPASMARLTDGKQPVLNEVAVAQLGYRGRATGQMVDEELQVGGVVKDFNYMSLQNEIRPLFIYIGLDTASSKATGTRVLFVRFKPNSDVRDLIRQIGDIYAVYDKKAGYSYQFLDAAYDNEYKDEDKLAGLIGIFTVITVVIACLGLFALATFSAEQRIKEVGIRKVLGASVSGIASHLSLDFLKPVLLSLLIAIPVSAWVMHQWLNGYAYRTALSWWVFPAAALLTGVIALLTVFFLSVKAARANPVKSLRSE